MYKINITKKAKKDLEVLSKNKKLIKNNKTLENRIDTALIKLSENPEQISYKVGNFWSARITGDIRIIWEYKNNQMVLLLLKIGGHSGGKSVY